MESPQFSEITKSTSRLGPCCRSTPPLWLAYCSKRSHTIRYGQFEESAPCHQPSSMNEPPLSSAFLTFAFYLSIRQLKERVFHRLSHLEISIIPFALPQLSSINHKMAANDTTNGVKGAPEPWTLAPILGMAAYRAPSLLQPHRAREALADAHAGRISPLVGFFCGLACPPVAKIAAQCGWDVVWIDWEHSSMSVETMTQVNTTPLIL